jgi:hypothetical protein
MQVDYDVVGFDAESIINYNEPLLCGLLFELLSKELHAKFGYPSFYADVS